MVLKVNNNDFLAMTESYIIQIEGLGCLFVHPTLHLRIPLT